MAGPKIPKDPKEIGRTVLIDGGLALGGLMLSRAVVPRIAADNTFSSAIIKGVAAVALSPVNKKVAVGVAVDAADDVFNRLTGGGGNGRGTGTGRFI